MPADRVSSYLNKDGEEATVEELTCVLSPAVAFIVDANVNIYDSSDMKVGISVELLKNISYLACSSVSCELTKTAGISSKLTWTGP